jgi:hypothetical protein
VSRPRLRTLLLALLALAGLTSCGRGCGCKGPAGSGQGAAGESGAQPEARVDMETVQKAWRQAERSVQAVETLAMNTGSYQSTLAKHSRNFAGVGAFKQVPREPATEELKAQLEAAAKAHGVTIAGFRVSGAEAPPPRELPDRHDGPVAFKFEDSDLLLTIRVGFRLEPLDAGKVESFARSLPKAVTRVLILSSVKLGAGGADLNGKAYSFRKVRAPVMRFVPPQASRIYAEAGLAAGGPDCGGEARCADLVQKIEKRLAGIDKLRVDAEKSMRLLAEGHLWDARMKAFRRVLEEASNVRYSEILN